MRSSPSGSPADPGPSNGSTVPSQATTGDLASPFTQHLPGRPAPAAGRPGAALHVEGVERVDKPWGHEVVVAVLEGRYVGKILHVDAGAALSLQKHLAKDETLCVQSGRVVVEHGTDPRHLETVTLDPGQRVLIRANVVHRITAVVDSQILEVSTAWPGWRTDIVRLEDGYGRQGTTTP